LGRKSQLAVCDAVPESSAVMLIGHETIVSAGRLTFGCVASSGELLDGSLHTT
jgi:hypothetical protein